MHGHMNVKYGSLIWMEPLCKLGTVCISKRFQISMPIQSPNES